MQVFFTEEEAQSYTSLVVSQVLDHVDLTTDANEAIREWRGKLAVGTEDLHEFSIALNEVLGQTISEELSRQIRRRALMSFIVNRILDDVLISKGDRANIRRWKSKEMRTNSEDMKALHEKLNTDLERLWDIRRRSAIRKPDYR